MRELSDAEKLELLKSGCIFCGSEAFYEGPRALGISANIYCEFCRAGYNVTHNAMPWQMIALPSTSFPPGLVFHGRVSMPEFANALTRQIESRKP